MSEKNNFDFTQEVDDEISTHKELEPKDPFGIVFIIFFLQVKFYLNPSGIRICFYYI
jgi:hypothetical protein